MAADRSTCYVGNAWRSLKTTRNLFGKLCLLALIQFVPILGPIVAYGYFLGWAREAAWGIETPLPAHVFGRDDRDFWTRGAKAFAVNLLYGLIAVAFIGLVAAVEAVVPMFVAIDELGTLVLEIVCAVVTLAVALLLAGFEVVGLLRLSIYNRFGAAFQWGACAKMLFHHLGGVIKIALAFLLFNLLLAVPVVLIGLAFLPAVLAMVVSGFFGAMAVTTSALPEEVLVVLASGFGAAYVVNSIAGVIVNYLMMVVALMFEAFMWRAFGNWAARFDVPAWGGRFDPLPFERKTAPAAPQHSAGAQPVEQPAEQQPAEQQSLDQQPVPAPVQEAPKKNCHPVLVTVLCMLVSFLVALGASFGAGAAFSASIEDDPAAKAEFEQFLDDLEVELDEFLSEEFGQDDLLDSTKDFFESSRFVNA